MFNKFGRLFLAVIIINSTEKIKIVTKAQIHSMEIYITMLKNELHKKQCLMLQAYTCK